MWYVYKQYIILYIIRTYVHVPLFGLVSSLPPNEDANSTEEDGQEGQHQDNDPGQSRNDDQQ